MNKLEIAYYKVQHNGNTRFRVIIPKAMRQNYQGVRRRFFATAAAAQKFCDELSKARNGTVAALAILQPNVQEAILRAVRTMGERAERMDEAAAAFMLNLHHVPSKTATVKDVIAAALLSKKNLNVRDRYYGQLKSAWGKFALVFGHRPMHEITALEIERWVTSNGWAPVTRVGYLTQVNTLYTYAKDVYDCVQTNPVAKVQRPKVDQSEPCILSVAQCTELLAAALRTDPALAPYAALCLFGGIRPEECERLANEDMADPDHVNVRGKKAKSRARRVVSVQPVLRAWLKLGFELPLPNLRKRFEALRAAAGLVSIARTGKGRAERKTITWTGWGHDCMRHSFGSYHLAHFKNQDLTAAEMGHFDTEMLFKHYRALVMPKVAAKFWELTPKAVKAGTGNIER